jgi:multidrug efflux pump subunit AcrB
MNALIAWMVRNPVAANLLMVVLVVGGLFGAVVVQKEVEPPYELDVVEVRVAYPGASPEEVETGILMPVEEAVLGITGIEELTATAREGSGTVRMELVGGSDRMRVFQDVDQAVSRVRTFPDQAEQPEVQLLARQRSVMEVGLYGPVDVWTLRTLGERLRDQLRSHPDITQVGMRRVPDYVTHVEVPWSQLRAHGLTLADVAERIDASSRDVPAGAVEANNGEVVVRVRARKQWAEELARIPVVTSSTTGSIVTLGDIASVQDGFEEVSFHSRFDGTPSIEVQVYRIGDQSPLTVAAAVEEVMAAFEPSLPPGVRMRIDSNAADDFDERLGVLVENGLSGLLIVLVILSAFLEVRLAFWIMGGMAASFIGGLLVLPWVGVSVNMISMFAFLVVLGIVVDDAIVVGENVHELREQGLSGEEAAIRGTQDIAMPVVFSVLSTIVAFVPVLLLPGTTGLYWEPLPIVVIVVLLLSLVEALLILPSHLAHLGSPGPVDRLFARGQRVVAAVLKAFVDRLYGPTLGVCLRYRYLTLCAAVGLLVVTGAYATSAHMGMIMMPAVAADEIEAGVRLPVGVTRPQAARVAERLTDETMALFDTAGLREAAEGVKTNVRGENFIDVEIVMKPPTERELSAGDVIRIWRDTLADLPGVDRISFEAERGPGGARDDIAVDLSHPDMDVLAKASRAFVAEMERFETTRDVSDNYRPGKVQLDLELLPQGRLLGLTDAALGSQVRDAFFGAVALRQLRGTNEVEVRVELPPGEREDLRTFDELTVRTPRGVDVPLRDVARVVQTTAFTSIDRRAGRRAVTVSMDVEPKRAMGSVIEAIETEVLPALRADHPGLTWTFEGTQAEMRESTASLYTTFGLALGLVYALLAVAFRSYTQPLIVMVAIPFGAVGAVLGHMLLGYELSLISLMGMVALSGVVVNDSLIMVDAANRYRTREGLSAPEAIHRAGVRRFRPILLTTLTTFGGLTPIILERSSQANHLIPMAISLGFGIVFATAIILVLVPCLFLALEDLLGTRGTAGEARSPG